MVNRRIAPLLAIVGLALILALPASAAGPTRDEYKAQVEPICEANKAASDRYLKGVRTLVKKDKLKQAAACFSKAAAALERAQKQLAAVPQPPADAPKLAKWLAGIMAEAKLMRTIAKKLQQGNKAKASSLAVKLTHDANATNNLVIVFQFNYCRIDHSRYT